MGMKRAFRLPALDLGMLLTLAGASHLVRAQGGPSSVTIVVPAAEGWMDTGIEMNPGVSCTVTATGVILASCGPEGGTCPTNPDGANPQTGKVYACGVGWVGGPTPQEPAFDPSQWYTPYFNTLFSGIGLMPASLRCGTGRAVHTPAAMAPPRPATSFRRRAEVRTTGPAARGEAVRRER